MNARSGLLFSILCLTIFGCGKNKYDNDASALWNYKIETTFDEMTNISDQAITGNMVYYKSGEIITLIAGEHTDYVKTPCSVVITIDTLASPKVLTVDYGNTNCTCNDGKTRRGKIITTFTGPYLSLGTVITHTPDNYYVNDIKYEGIKTVTNLGLNTNGQPHFDVQINGSATMTSGEIVTYTSSRSRTWVEGYTTLLNRFDDAYDITGNAIATYSSGGGYSCQTNTPIHVKVGCGFPVSGILQITPTNKPVRIVDYGSGACDYTFTVTVNGITFTIN
jgi:hypothetical protein